MLSFLFISFSESGHFNGLQPIQIKNSFPFEPSGKVSRHFGWGTPSPSPSRPFVARFSAFCKGIVDRSVFPAAHEGCPLPTYGGREQKGQGSGRLERPALQIGGPRALGQSRERQALSRPPIPRRVRCCVSAGQGPYRAPAASAADRTFQPARRWSSRPARRWPTHPPGSSRKRSELWPKRLPLTGIWRRLRMKASEYRCILPSPAVTPARAMKLPLTSPPAPNFQMAHRPSAASAPTSAPPTEKPETPRAPRGT
jgi:hypothetical protein